MAQYYNFVTNTSGTITLEDVQRICSVEGQSVQFVVEDINNGGNGSAQFVTYAATSQSNEQTIFSPQTVNLGGQIATTQLDQRQNFYIIKTNEISASQNLLKTDTIDAHTVSDDIVNIVDHKETKVSVNNSPEGQNMQWMKMQESNINVETLLSQNALIKNQSSIAIRNQQQNSITSPLLHSSGLCSQIEPQPFSPIEKKPVRLYQNRNKQSVRSTQSVATSNCLQAGKTSGSPGDHTLNSDLINNRRCSSSFRLKTFCTPGSDVIQTSARQVRTPNQSDSLQTRNSISLESPRTPSPIQHPEMEHLSERIKQARLIQLQAQRQMHQNHQQSQQGQTLSNPNQRQLITNIGQQREQMTLLSQQQLQRQTIMPSNQSQQQLSMSLPDHCVQEAMDIDLSDSIQEREKLNQQSCTSQTDSECNSTESFAYLQKVIDNPQTTVVQQQITGNTVKMLVILLNGEQRLITFDIPTEDCTVQDLLEQTNITFPGEPVVSLVSDPALGINYIVEPGPVQDGSEQNESNPSQEITNMIHDSSSPTFNASDENSNSSITQNEEPKYVEGKLAVCSHCGISSPDFNRCQRCKRKLPEDVKAIPMAMHMQTKRENMLTIDVKTFYKKSNEQSLSSKLDKLERDGSTNKRGRGRGRNASKSKPAKEPECLTISSDEENDDEGKTKVKVESDNNNTSVTMQRHITSEESETILEKEPIITNNSVSIPMDDSIDSEEDEKRECEVHNTEDDTNPILQTSLLCRTVRIGSYKYVPREKITISQSGVRLGVPLLEDDRNFVTLTVKLKDIVKVLIHFGKSMPVLFFYTTTNTGAMIRELLGMQDPKGPYYDPAGRDHTHKRITLLPEKLTEESKNVLNALFSSNGLLEKLNPKEANDILVRASPKDSLQVQSITKKQGSASLSNNTSINSGIQTIMVYPPPPAKGGIAINTEDYACLAEDQFLNDVIIDFYLKYLTLEVLSETDQNRTHVFSSYFYKRLTSPHALATENTTPLSPAAKRHARVQKWTKNVNIFEKDFIIIPINEHAHWFLAIICFPGLVGKVPVVPPNAKEHDIQKAAAKSKKLKEIKLQAVTIGNTTITPVATTITIDQGDDGSERDEAEGDDEEMEMDSDEEEEFELQEDTNQQTKMNLPTPQQKEVVKIPCILIFDSLAGASRSRVVATLRDYLSCEHLAKIGTDKVFSKDTIKGASPKVPQQSNFTDCGVYVLQYVESFFKDPITDYTLSIKTLKNWFEEIVVTRKREELSKLLIRLMNETKGDKNIILPVLTFPTQDGKLLPKPENHVELKPVKSETETKKKPTSDRENRISNNSMVSEENSEQTNELNKTTTYQIIPYSPSSSCSSTESNQTEMFTEAKTLTRSSSETMTYLKTKRIPRLVSRMSENQDDKQTAKKHKGDSFDSCK